MGFPKPWPTEWPEPADYPEIPIDPDNFPNPHRPLPDEDYDYGDTEQLPEYRHKFYAVTWAVNHACNLKCSHCYDVVSYQRHDLSTRDALNLIDHLAEAGVNFIAFSGGEAFLRKDLFTLMEHCKNKGMNFSARSNGTRINGAVAERLRDLGISVVGISFDGASPETHDAVRGLGAFKESMAGLKALRNEGIRAQMEVVLSKKNAHEALEFIRLGESVGADEVNFSTMAVLGRAKQRSEDALDYPIWLQLTSQLRAASKSSSVPVTPNCALTGLCVANLEPHISSDGWISPCYLSDKKLFKVLDTAPEEIRSLLAGSRASYQNICGRQAWMTQPKQVD